MVTASYRPRLLAPTSAEFTLNMNWYTSDFLTSVDVFIWRLSWNLQCDTLLQFYEKWHITPMLKFACALNENTMSETKQNEIVRGDRMS